MMSLHSRQMWPFLICNVLKLAFRKMHQKNVEMVINFHQKPPSYLHNPLLCNQGCMKPRNELGKKIIMDHIYLGNYLFQKLPCVSEVNGTSPSEVEPRDIWTVWRSILLKRMAQKKNPLPYSTKCWQSV